MPSLSDTETLSDVGAEALIESLRAELQTAYARLEQERTGRRIAEEENRELRAINVRLTEQMDWTERVLIDNAAEIAAYRIERSTRGMVRSVEAATQ